MYTHSKNTLLFIYFQIYMIYLLLLLVKEELFEGSVIFFSDSNIKFACSFWITDWEQRYTNTEVTSAVKFFKSKWAVICGPVFELQLYWTYFVFYLQKNW